MNWSTYFSFVFWLVCGCLCLAQDDKPRDWTSDTGTTVRATLVGSETVTVYVLRKEDGTEIRVPANRLSPESRALAEDILKSRSKGPVTECDTTAKDVAAKKRTPQPPNDAVEEDVAGKGATVEKVGLPTPTTFSDLLGPVRSLTFSPTGGHLFVTFLGPRGRLWSCLNWEEVHARSPDCGYFGRPAVFSPDGKFLACCDGELIRVWALQNSPAKLVTTVQGSRRGALGDFSHSKLLYVWADNGTLVALGNGGLQCLKYDAVRGAIPVATVTGQTSVDSLKEFHGAKIDCGQLLNEVIGIPDSAVSPKGDLFAAAVTVGRWPKGEGVFLWEIPSAKLVSFLEAEVLDGRGLVMSSDGTLVGASRLTSQTTIVSLWQTSSPYKRIDLSDDELNTDRIGRIGDFRVRCFCLDGTQVATSSRIDIQTAAGPKTKWVVAVWDSTNGKRAFQFEAPGVQDVFFARDGKTLVVGGSGDGRKGFVVAGSGDGRESQEVQLRDVQTGDVRFQVTDNGISTLALSPDGKLLLTGYHWQDRIRAWEVK